MHQDARANGESFHEVMRGWVTSLSSDEKSELRPFLQSVLDQVNGFPSCSRLMKLFAPSWNIPEKTLKVVFRDAVLKELNTC